jgi:putative ABC transport system substrate-binding protein
MRRIGLAVVLALFIAPFVVEAQEAGKVWRIGFLGPGSGPPVPFLTGLRDFGYVEGRNILIEYRWAEGKYERLPDLAAELVQRKVDVLVTGGTAGVRAAKQATTTIPIVMTASGDAVSSGLVASLARPGGNVTGSTFFVPELMAKRLELLKEAMPRTTRVAVLINADDPSHVPVLKAMESTARSLKIEIQKFEVRRPSEIESAFTAMAKSREDAVVVQEDNLLTTNTRVVVGSAVKNQLPLAGQPTFAEAGGQIGYGVDQRALVRRAAYFVDKILKGAKPADLPVEQPTKFELVINLKTAKALGLTIPQTLLLRADQVIQ